MEPGAAEESRGFDSLVSVASLGKAQAVRRTVEEPIWTNCPLTLLRTHHDATIHLDIDSESELDKVSSPD